MIVLCDEMMGKGVPESLRNVGYPVTNMKRTRMLTLADVNWLRIAGRKGWLVISKNKKMLLVDPERETIINEKVGVIFLTQDMQDLPKLLKLLLVKWSWITSLETKPRPFALFLSSNGRVSDHYRDRRRRDYRL